MSYQYKSTAKTPVQTIKLDHENADAAIRYARSQHGLPDGTTIKIERGQPDYFGIVAWVPYRSYVVEGGIVRRTDR